MVSQVASFIGACMILLAYFGFHAGHLKESSWLYFLLNFIGASLLLLGALWVRQIGFIFLEGAWVLITLYGFFRVRRGGKPLEEK